MRKLLSSAAAAAVLLAGCVSNDNASGKGGSSGAQRLSVTIADDKCDVSAEKTESGRVVFTLKNEGTVKNEFEILAPDKLRIVGERENLAPGTTVKYTVVLEPGSYYTACKKNMVGALVGAKKFTVSDSGKKVEASGDEKKLQEQAVSNYNAYNRDQAGQLLEKTKAFAEAYKAGDLDKARSLYAATRQHYERIEPTAEKFGDLDPALDEREADWQETEDKDTRAWKGWHYMAPRRLRGAERRAEGEGLRAARRRHPEALRSGIRQGLLHQARRHFERRHQPARGSRNHEDHGRGGSLLPHRSVGLPGECRRRQGRLRQRRGNRQEERSGAGQGDFQALRPASGRA